MSAVDEIRAAIDQMTVLKSVGVMYPDLYDCTVAEWSAACGLITTLHRTIDAQLLILKNDMRMYSDYQRAGWLDQWVSAVERAGDLALARAINGVTA